MISRQKTEENNNCGGGSSDIEEEDDEEDENGFMRPLRFQRQCSMNSATKRRHQSMPHTTELLASNFQNSCQISADEDDNEDDDGDEHPSGSELPPQIPTSSCASSDDGFASSYQSGDLEQLHQNQRASLRRRIKALKEPDSISDESGYHESGVGSGSESKTTTSRQSLRSTEYR